MKKNIISIGTITIVAVPLIVVVSCNNANKKLLKKDEKVIKNIDKNNIDKEAMNKIPFKFYTINLKGIKSPKKLRTTFFSQLKKANFFIKEKDKNNLEGKVVFITIIKPNGDKWTSKEVFHTSQKNRPFMAEYRKIEEKVNNIWKIKKVLENAFIDFVHK